MLKKVRETIDENALLFPGSFVIIAVSGGPDSIALLKAIAILADEYRLRLAAAHFNHCLRGEESLRDEHFVRDTCQKMGITLYDGRADPSTNRLKNKFSEAWARKERYSFLAGLAARVRADRVALGHNSDDQVETVVMNILRGSGITGLKGILPLRNGLFIRPLLNVSRQEILSFLRREGLTFIDDSSNFDESYRRNKIRNSLIPYLKEAYEPQLDRHIQRLSFIARIEDEYLSLRAREYLDNTKGRLHLDSLLAQHEAIVRRVIKSLLHNIFPPDKEPGFPHIEAVHKFIKKKQPHSLMSVCRNWQLKITDGYLVVEQKTVTFPKQLRQGRGYFYPVPLAGQVIITEINRIWNFSIIDKSSFDEHYQAGKAIFLDYEKICPPICLRTRLPGDRIMLHGMAGRKSIKEYFVDQKIPRDNRELVPLLVDCESVIAIADERISQRVRVSDATRSILKIEII